LVSTASSCARTSSTHHSEEQLKLVRDADLPITSRTHPARPASRTPVRLRPGTSPAVEQSIADHRRLSLMAAGVKIGRKAQMQALDQPILPLKPGQAE
jgi:hypothetical protein